jgi:hypothetical protein
VVAAPLGLSPCPTLSAVIGLTLMLDLVWSRAWSWMLAAFGAAYGLIGALRLGVAIDVLLFGAHCSWLRPCWAGTSGDSAPKARQPDAPPTESL